MKKLQRALSIILATALVMTSIAPYSTSADDFTGDTVPAVEAGVENPAETPDVSATPDTTEPSTEVPDTVTPADPAEGASDTSYPEEPVIEAPPAVEEPPAPPAEPEIPAEVVNYVPSLTFGTEGDFQVTAGLYAPLPDTTALKISGYNEMLPWFNYDDQALISAFRDPVKQQIAAFYGLDIANTDFDGIFKYIYPFEISLLDKDNIESKPALDITMSIPNPDAVRMINENQAQVRVFVFDKLDLLQCYFHD